jgi:NTP pyrophosphatase (non-canonical NTP hydrolase)
VNLTDAAERVNRWAIGRGFWEQDDGTAALHEEVKFGRLHSEVDEAFRAWRAWRSEELEEELADIIIRVLDLAGHWKIDIEEAVADKMAINERRPYKHGRTRG